MNQFAWRGFHVGSEDQSRCALQNLDIPYHAVDFYILMCPPLPVFIAILTSRTLLTPMTEGDRVLLTAQTRSRKSLLTKPLRLGAQVPFLGDSIQHDSIIGKSARDVVQGSRSKSLRASNL